MRKLNIDYSLGLWAAVIILLTNTLPRIAYFGHHRPSHHSPEVVVFISVLSLLIFAVVPPIVEGFLYRLLPTKIVRRFSKKDSTLVVILAVLAVIFGIEHRSLVGTLGHITANTLYLIVFMRRGYWASVATNGFANVIIFIVGRLFRILILP